MIDNDYVEELTKELIDPQTYANYLKGIDTLAEYIKDQCPYPHSELMDLFPHKPKYRNTLFEKLSCPMSVSIVRRVTEVMKTFEECDASTYDLVVELNEVLDKHRDNLLS